MTSLSLYSKGWLLALPMLILAAGTAAAQLPDSFFFDDSALRSFRIADGAVFIDGREIPPEKLPEGFPPEAVSVYYKFSPGMDEDLKIQIKGGEQYVLKGDTLELFPNGVELSQVDYVFRRLEGDYPSDAAPVLFISSVSPEAILARKAKDLRANAIRLQDLQDRFDESHTGDLRQMVEEMTMHAAEAARTASEFPHIQMQYYLSDIQDNNKGLFDQLMSERLMEHETAIMARKVAAMEKGKARRDSIAVLRERLTEIFELKQENRRREMEQLEEKLQELQKAVSERERLGDQIVDRRLQELLGNDTLDW